LILGHSSIEIIQPGERSGQRALLSVDRFNQLASSGDMPAVGDRW
jgi:hypothetical protein